MDLIRVEVVLALPRSVRSVEVALSAGATVRDAVAASGLPLEGIRAYAVHGERAGPDTGLRDGDRVELLRPLLVDPKEARRRRATKGL